jgi:helix-turn-helix protein
MRTIPDAVLDAIVEHRPHLALMVNNLRAAALEGQIWSLERHIATNYLLGESHLSGAETWYLAQVSYGGPWGGDWISTAHAAELTGYDDAHLRRLAGSGALPALKRGKTWYLRRDALPVRGP